MTNFSRFLPIRFGRVPRFDTHGIERLLAASRALAAISSFAAFSLHPVGPPEYFARASGLFVGYAVYALCVLAASWTGPRFGGRRLHRVLYTLDIAWPTAITLFTGGPESSFFGLFVIALLSAAYRWHLRETFLTAVIAAAALIVEAFLVTPHAVTGRLLAGSVDITLVVVHGVYLLAGGGLLGCIIDHQKRLRRRTEAAERARLAHELHDRTVQSLIGLEMQIEVWRRETTGTAAARLAHIQKSLREEVRDLRDLVQRLKPAAIDPAHVLQHLADLIDTFGRQTGIAARFVSEVDRLALSPRVCGELVRIVQEALANVRKHSGAEHVVVRVSAPSGCWKLEVDDDGRGFDFAGRHSQSDLDLTRTGPHVIQERVRSIGGQLAVESAPGEGARLEVLVPRRMHG